MKCTQCNSNEFKEISLSTTDKEENSSTRSFVCLKCGHIEWFLHDDKIKSEKNTHKLDKDFDYLTFCQGLLQGYDVRTGELLADNDLIRTEEVQKLLKLSLEKIKYKSREKVKNSRKGESWTKNEDEQLKKEYLSKVSLKDICKNHQRSSGAISARIIKLFPDMLNFREEGTPKTPNLSMEESPHPDVKSASNESHQVKHVVNKSQYRYTGISPERDLRGKIQCICGNIFLDILEECPVCHRTPIEIFRNQANKKKD